jgi:hypothetical protein
MMLQVQKTETRKYRCCFFEFVQPQLRIPRCITPQACFCTLHSINSPSPYISWPQLGLVPCKPGTMLLLKWLRASSLVPCKTEMLVAINDFPRSH